MKPELFKDTERSKDITFTVHKLRPNDPPSASLTNSTYDYEGYLGSDMSENHRIYANHSHIYIEGDMKSGSKVSLRQGVVSTRSLGEDAQVEGGILLIIGDEQLSKKSINFTKSSNDHPTILVVPENERARVFDLMTALIRHQPNFPPVQQLQELKEKLPTLPTKIISGNAHDAGILKEAGLLGRGI